MDLDFNAVLVGAIVGVVVLLERAILWRFWLTSRELLDEIHRRKGRTIRRRSRGR